VSLRANNQDAGALSNRSGNDGIEDMVNRSSIPDDEIETKVF